MLKIIFYVLFILPLMFQVIFGTKAVRQSGRLKLWQVALISIAGQILLTLANTKIMSVFIEESGTHDGLPFVGVLILSGVIGAIMLLVILVQAIVLLRGKKR
ncbi:MAG: hypothetical protein ACK5M7_09070 [Draconibacterium sp.]